MFYNWTVISEKGSYSDEGQFGACHTETTLIRMCQVRPKNPYNVRVIDFHVFKNHETVKFILPCIRPGKKRGDPIETDIQHLKYTHKICIKTDHSGTWKELIKSSSMTSFTSLGNS